MAPFRVIESGAEIAEGCRLASHVVVKQGTSIGRETVVFDGAVLGGLPQHTNMPPRQGRVTIGQRCTIREHATVNRALHEDRLTQVGDDCLLMIGAHVAHDCVVGDRVILTNHVLLGGHVEVGQRACLGGAAVVHQFCRVGQLAMVGGCGRIVQDVPPFVMVDGDSNLIVGLNRVGLRRGGLSRDAIAQVKRAYQLIYRQGYSFEEILGALDAEFTEGPASTFAEFFRQGKRGFVQERRRPPKAAIRLHRTEEAPQVEEKTPVELRRRLAG